MIDEFYLESSGLVLTPRIRVESITDSSPKLTPKTKAKNYPAAAGPQPSTTR